MEKRKTTKIKFNKKKKGTPQEGVWGEDWSLVEVEKDKCIISFPVREYGRDAFDTDLGLIGILLMNKIVADNVYKRPMDIVFAYNKRYAKKIKDIEKAYFTGKIKIDAKDMSNLTIFVVNYLEPKGWREKLDSEKKMALKKKK
jgi:hypothetical protein